MKASTDVATLQGTAPTFVDVFCGVGGLSLGCIQAGMTQLAAFDSDPVMVAAYGANLRTVQPGLRVYQRDVRTLTADDVVAAAGGQIPDVIVGGPPCQGFSVRGRRRAGDPRSELSFRFVELAASLRPPVVAMENVDGILSMGDTAEDLRRALVDAGYANAVWRRVNAAEFGVPQRRARALLIASRTGAVPTLDGIVSEGRGRTTVTDAFAGLPRARLKEYLPTDGRITYPRTSKWSEYALKLRSQANGVSGCQRTRHLPGVLAHLRSLTPGEYCEDTGYRRLKPSGLSFTIRAGTRRRTAFRPVHPTANRVITVREAARLQSFPDWYEFDQVVSLAHVQIGNSVPPLMAQHLAVALRHLATKTRSDSSSGMRRPALFATG